MEQMLYKITLALSLLLALASSALAQTAPDNTTPGAAQPTAQPSSSSQSSGSEESMEPPMLGDHWTYQLRDEITGEIKTTLTNIITDLTPTNIAVRIQSQAYSQGPTVFIYDRSWNLKINPTWTYSPNDGSGIKTPLAVGDAWKFQDNQIRTGYGTTFRNVGTSKVVGTESITTDAGTFQALKIETSINGHNANDSTKRFESTITTWYVPSIDHWIKRTVKAAFNGNVQEDDTLELVDYGRR